MGGARRDFDHFNEVHQHRKLPYYDVLGVTPDATTSEIIRAYRDLVWLIWNGQVNISMGDFSWSSGIVRTVLDVLVFLECEDSPFFNVEPRKAIFEVASRYLTELWRVSHLRLRDYGDIPTKQHTLYLCRGGGGAATF